MEKLGLAGNMISEMRLLLEGAIVLYEGDAACLYEQTNAHAAEKVAFNDVGSALYLLLELVKTMECACDIASGAN